MAETRQTKPTGLDTELQALTNQRHHPDRPLDSSSSLISFRSDSATKRAEGLAAKRKASYKTGVNGSAFPSEPKSLQPPILRCTMVVLPRSVSITLSRTRGGMAAARAISHTLSVRRRPVTPTSRTYLSQFSLGRETKGTEGSAAKRKASYKTGVNGSAFPSEPTSLQPPIFDARWEPSCLADLPHPSSPSDFT